MRFNETYRLYAISWDHDFLNWYAWVSWRASAVNLRYQPENLTVPGQWPPTTSAGVEVELSRESSLRKELAEEHKGRSRNVWRPFGDKLPWAEWTDGFKTSLMNAEKRRRENEGDLWFSAPTYPADPAFFVARIRQSVWSVNKRDVATILRY